jgi:FKBP-type peptidyl-prolyl cis-trans isomerase
MASNASNVTETQSMMGLMNLASSASSAIEIQAKLDLINLRIKHRANDQKHDRELKKVLMNELKHKKKLDKLRSAELKAASVSSKCLVAKSAKKPKSKKQKPKSKTKAKKEKKKKKPKKAKKSCKCGGTDHQRTTFKNCPLNSTNNESSSDSDMSCSDSD